MSPRHFSKQMYNPTFHTKHFQEESKTAQIEKKIEDRFFKIIIALNPLYWIKKFRSIKTKNKKYRN